MRPGAELTTFTPKEAHFTRRLVSYSQDATDVELKNRVHSAQLDWALATESGFVQDSRGKNIGDNVIVGMLTGFAAESTEEAISIRLSEQELRYIRVLAAEAVDHWINLGAMIDERFITQEDDDRGYFTSVAEEERIKSEMVTDDLEEIDTGRTIIATIDSYLLD